MLVTPGNDMVKGERGRYSRKIMFMFENYEL